MRPWRIIGCAKRSVAQDGEHISNVSIRLRLGVPQVSASVALANAQFAGRMAARAGSDVRVLLQAEGAAQWHRELRIDLNITLRLLGPAWMTAWSRPWQLLVQAWRKKIVANHGRHTELCNMMRPRDACEGASEDDERMCGTCAETFQSRRAPAVAQAPWTRVSQGCWELWHFVGMSNGGPDDCSICSGERERAKKRGAVAGYRVLRRSSSHTPTMRIGSAGESGRGSDLPSCRVRHRSDGAADVHSCSSLRSSRSLRSLTERFYLNRVSSQIGCTWEGF